jgi:hypothetical protein
MSARLEMNKAEIVITVLFGWEKVTKHVILKCNKVLAQPIHKVIACSFFQCEV